MIRSRTDADGHGDPVIALITRLIIALYFIETGVLLIVAPWTPWWRRNFFAQVVPSLMPVMASWAVRWGVVVIGLLTLAGGLRELRGLFTPERDVSESSS